MSRFIYIGIGAILVIALLSFYRFDADQPVEAFQKSDGLPQVIKSPPLSGSYEFAGEVVPVDQFDVRERLERELTVNAYWHSSTILHIKRAARFLPLFHRILSEEDIPTDFKYLAVAESGLENVSSPAGAKGMWQFMKPTAEFYGLEVNAAIDERYHIEKSTRAFCQYIRHLKSRFGTWTAAAAAYNMGETRFSAESKQQKTANYYDMNLSMETMRYLFRIIALREIIESPEQYGFHLNPSDLYAPYPISEQVAVEASVEDLAVFAQTQGVSYRMLKVYNPWLLSGSLPVSTGKTYYLDLPK